MAVVGKDIKIGIVGAAGRGRGFFRAFQNNPQTEITALFSAAAAGLTLLAGLLSLLWFNRIL